MLWEVRPEEKKNVYTRTTYVVSSDSEVAAGKVFYMEEVYRWGRCVIRSDEKPTYNTEDPYSVPFELSDYEVEDQESDDGCSLDFKFEDDWTDEERAHIEGLWEKDQWYAFDDNQIYADDIDTKYYGPLEIVCIDDTPEVEAPKSTSGWPF